MSASQRHPHLFFGADDIGAIRRNTQHPRFRRDWEALRKAADQDLEGPPVGEGRPAAVLSEAAQRAARCAFVYVAAEERQFAERALECVEALLPRADEWRDWMCPGQHLPFHLLTAAVCNGLALTYDLLAADMSAQQRKRVVSVCVEKAVGVFLDDCNNGLNPHLSGERAMNWLSVLASGAGLLMIAMDGDGVDLSREIEIARAHMLRFIEWYDDAGCATEHGGYWRYGMGHCVEFLAALRRNGWPDIFHQQSRKLDRTPYPNLYFNVAGVNAANFGDDPRAPLTARDAVLILAAEFRDRRLQWWAEQLPPGGALSLIFGDTELPATPPDDLPTCAVFDGCGVAVLRSSLTDPDALFLGLKGGRARGRITDHPHCHFDLNAVVVEAFGAPLIADPGYGHNWVNPTHSPTDHEHPYNGPAAHNTLLVNARGPLYENSPLAHLQDLSPDGDIDYVVSRVERGYAPELVRFDRHAYMIGKSFYVLLDDIELKEPARLTWHFHTPEEAEIEIRDNPVIVNAGAQLRIVPFGVSDLRAQRLDDHVLPRIQFDTPRPVTSARAGWLLWPQRVDAAPPVVALDGDNIHIRHESRARRLPIVRRRASCRSALNVIPDLDERVREL